MAAITNKEIEKWGEMFKGEEMVDLFIPKDQLNKDNARWMCINGQEIWLAVGKKIKVPASVAELFNRAYSETLEAQEKMSNQVQIG